MVHALGCLGTGDVARVGCVRAAESLAEASGASGQGSWLVVLLFAVAGLLVGGAWSAHQAESRLLAIICAALAAISLIAGLAWLIGGMT